MKQSMIFLIIIWICILVSSVNSQVEISFSPSISLLNGHTDYSMRVSGSFVDSSFTQVRQTVASLLEFPISSKQIGFDLKLSPQNDRTKGSFTLSYYTSISDPSDEMIDSDWDEKLPYYTETHFSYTESPVDLSMYKISVEISYRLAKYRSTSFAMLIGFHQQKIKQRIVGFAGWYKRLENQTTWSNPVYFSFDDPALNYEIKFNKLLIGIQTYFEFSPQFLASVKTAFSPVFYSDTDDHLLRNKLSTSSGDGPGFTGGLNGTYYIKNKEGLSKYFISFDINYFTANPEGKQKQEWYDDETYIDPNTGQEVVWVESGTVFIGIPHKIKTSQTKFGLKVGYSF